MGGHLGRAKLYSHRCPPSGMLTTRSQRGYSACIKEERYDHGNCVVVDDVWIRSLIWAFGGEVREFNLWCCALVLTETSADL
jgi:hypothetical protein